MCSTVENAERASFHYAMSASVATRTRPSVAPIDFASHSVVVMYLPLTAHDMSSVRLADITDISRRSSPVTCDMVGAVRSEVIEPQPPRAKRASCYALSQSAREWKSPRSRE